MGALRWARMALTWSRPSGAVLPGIQRLSRPSQGELRLPGL